MSKLQLQKACCTTARQKRGAGPARLWEIGPDVDVEAPQGRKNEATWALESTKWMYWA